MEPEIDVIRLLCTECQQEAASVRFPGVLGWFCDVCAEKIKRQLLEDSSEATWPQLIANALKD